MRTIARVTFVALIASAILASQSKAAEAPPAPGALAACSHLSQAGMRDCLALEAQRTAAVLAQAASDAAAAIARWDEDARYAGAAASGLKASNAAFGRYRQAQCALASALAGGGAGNAREISRLACVAELNTRRAAELAQVRQLAPR